VLPESHTHRILKARRDRNVSKEMYRGTSRLSSGSLVDCGARPVSDKGQGQVGAIPACTGWRMGVVVGVVRQFSRVKSFDPQLSRIVGDSFATAWNTLCHHGYLAVLGPNHRRAKSCSVDLKHWRVKVSETPEC
jgi:hypothetical protein